jgi:hypothetical protein
MWSEKGKNPTEVLASVGTGPKTRLIINLLHMVKNQGLDVFSENTKSN